jgi:hypothetical protein
VQKQREEATRIVRRVAAERLGVPLESIRPETKLGNCVHDVIMHAAILCLPREPVMGSKNWTVQDVIRHIAA